MNRTCCRRCDARLRQGQTGDLCDPCTRQQTPGELLPAGFFTADRMRQALAGYDFATVFLSVRRAAGYSQQRLGDLIDLPQERISRIERRTHRLRDIAIIARVTSRLGIPSDLLGFTAGAATVLGVSTDTDLGFSRPGLVARPSADPVSGTPSGIPATPSSGRPGMKLKIDVARRALEAGEEGGPTEKLQGSRIDRRRWRDTSHGQDGAHSVSTDEELIKLAASESIGFGRRHGATNIHIVAMEQLAEEVQRLGRDFIADRPATTVLRSRALRDEIFSLLEGSNWPQQKRSLYGLASRTCGFLAAASSDFYGLYDPAADQCRTAWQLAELADFPELRSWIRSLQSSILFWAGRWIEAAELADHALALAVTRSGVSRAASMKARALARLGDVTGVHSAVIESQRVPEIEILNQETGVILFQEVNRLRCVGTAYLWVGEHDEARNQLQQALQEYQATRPHDYAVIAVIRVDLAAAHLANRDLDGAIETLEPLLRVDEDRRFEGTLRRIRELRKLLDSSPYFKTTPKALALSDRLCEFIVQSSTSPKLD